MRYDGRTMKSAPPKTARTKSQPVSVLTSRLRRFVRTCETRYEMTADQARKAVRSERLPETAEIARWFQADLVLRKVTSTNGTRTKATASRTKASFLATRSSKTTR